MLLFGLWRNVHKGQGQGWYLGKAIALVFSFYTFTVVKGRNGFPLTRKATVW